MLAVRSNMKAKAIVVMFIGRKYDDAKQSDTHNRCCRVGGGGVNSRGWLMYE